MACSPQWDPKSARKIESAIGPRGCRGKKLVHWLRDYQFSAGSSSDWMKRIPLKHCTTENLPSKKPRGATLCQSSTRRARHGYGIAVGPHLQSELRQDAPEPPHAMPESPAGDGGLFFSWLRVRRLTRLWLTRRVSWRCPVVPGLWRQARRPSSDRPGAARHRLRRLRPWAGRLRGRRAVCALTRAQPWTTPNNHSLSGYSGATSGGPSVGYRKHAQV